MNKIKNGIFPGSFDPITVGHEYIILKAAEMVENLVIGVGNNSNKNHHFSIEKREEWVKKHLKIIPIFQLKSIVV